MPPQGSGKDAAEERGDDDAGRHNRPNADGEGERQVGRGLAEDGAGQHVAAGEPDERGDDTEHDGLESEDLDDPRPAVAEPSQEAMKRRRSGTVSSIALNANSSPTKAPIAAKSPVAWSIGPVA